MIPLAIEILWFIIGLIILGAVVWIALYVLRSVFPQMPAVVDRAVWGVFGILCLIYALMMLQDKIQAHSGTMSDVLSRA
jgi:lysylphosphatidylglycerol synthetase-like protein (DUF2156 family)